MIARLYYFAIVIICCCCYHLQSFWLQFYSELCFWWSCEARGSL